MATTGGNLVAGKAAGKVASQGGNGNNGRFGLKAKLAAGIAILGCTAALVLAGCAWATPASPTRRRTRRCNRQRAATASAQSGRAGPSDEYLQADFANALPIPQRSGPADEYTQGAFASLPQAIVRTGPADEYTQADGATPAVVTHGTGPANGPTANSEVQHSLVAGRSQVRPPRHRLELVDLRWGV